MNEKDLLDPLALAQRLRDSDLNELVTRLRAIHDARDPVPEVTKPSYSDVKRAVRSRSQARRQHQRSARRRARSELTSWAPLQSELRLLLNDAASAGRFSLVNELNSAITPRFEITPPTEIPTAEWSRVTIEITPKQQSINPCESATFKLRLDLADLYRVPSDEFEIAVDVRAGRRLLHKLWLTVRQA